MYITTTLLSAVLIFFTCNCYSIRKIKFVFKHCCLRIERANCYANFSDLPLLLVKPFP